VPGPRGVHRPIWAAGGETILPTHKGSMGSPIIFDMRGAVITSERDAELLVRKGLGRAIRSGNPVSIGGKTIR
jgi:hypothetical protein